MSEIQQYSAVRAQNGEVARLAAENAQLKAELAEMEEEGGDGTSA